MTCHCGKYGGWFDRGWHRFFTYGAKAHRIIRGAA